MNIFSIIKYSFLFFMVFISMTSCEDEIDIELEPLTEELVVDAWLTNQDVPQTINLSMSQPFLSNTLPVGVSGATVKVSSSEGVVFDFIETKNGNYVWEPEDDKSLGETGTQYELQITVDGQNYFATSNMNRVPPIDSLVYELREDDPFGPDGIYAQFYARDPIGTGDTYWVKSFKNNVFLNKPDEINLAFDAGFSSGGSADGLTFITPIREAINRIADSEGEDDFEVAPWQLGDEVRVEIHAINNDAFYFLSSAQAQITNGNSGIFSEPVINTVGNVFKENGEKALGLFNVAAVSQMTVLIE